MPCMPEMTHHFVLTTLQRRSYSPKISEYYLNPTLLVNHYNNYEKIGGTVSFDDDVSNSSASSDNLALLGMAFPRELT